MCSQKLALVQASLPWSLFCQMSSPMFHCALNAGIPVETRSPVATRPPATKKPPKRAISWSEDQINRLQKDNRELRQKILDQKRTDVEKDETIAFLTQQNAQYRQEIDRRTDVAQFANNIIVTVQDFQEAQSRQSASSSDYGAIPASEGRDSGTMGDMLNDIIRIYSQI
ncbi:hypothetical protein F4824DRAFT_234757 [Ustulina deusta]|nr:hypothetical protein F4824DRAFT_234757 [Ustulina deusta]